MFLSQIWPSRASTACKRSSRRSLEHWKPWVCIFLEATGSQGKSPLYSYPKTKGNSRVESPPGPVTMPGCDLPGAAQQPNVIRITGLLSRQGSWVQSSTVTACDPMDVMWRPWAQTCFWSKMSPSSCSIWHSGIERFCSFRLKRGLLSRSQGLSSSLTC